jgi:hypothetical protein
MTVEGIDVSHHQSTTPGLSGLGFLFARKSIGTQQDEKYGLHIGNARRAGLFTGAYHFNWSPISVADQVRAFLANAGDVDFYALDVEPDSGTPAFSRTQARDFISRVQATGREIGLYMSESAFFDAGQDWNWIANWSNRPSRPYRFWQYHGGPIDRNRFDGTLAQLRALAAGGTAGGKEDAVKGFTAPGAPKQYTIPKDRVLYRSSDLTPDPLNIVGHGPITGCISARLARQTGGSCGSSRTTRRATPLGLGRTSSMTPTWRSRIGRCLQRTAQPCKPRSTSSTPSSRRSARTRSCLSTSAGMRASRRVSKR